jgi:hypothetical protein
MAPPSRSARGFGADASGTVWEVGLVTMPAFVAQADGSTVRPLIAQHRLPIEVQLQATAKGLIPYVPALRAQPRGRA